MGTKASKPPVTQLKGDLDIFSIQNQAAVLKKAAGGRGPVLLDLSEVGDVDLSGIQLLLSLHKEKGTGGLKLQGLPASLVDRMKEVGLDSFLEETLT